MRFLGYDEKIVRLLESLYDGTMSAVRVDGSLSNWFITVVGVLQGCILSSLLFSIFLEGVIALALDGSEIGARVLGMVIPNLCFADDISLLADSEHELQHLPNRIHETSNKFGMTISNSKTEVQCIGKDRHQMIIKLGVNAVQQTDDFVYLGGTISADSNCDKESKMF